MKLNNRDLNLLIERCLTTDYYYPAELHNKDDLKSTPLVFRFKVNGISNTSLVQLGTKNPVNIKENRDMIANINKIIKDAVVNKKQNRIIKRFKNNVNHLVKANIVEKEDADIMVTKIDNRIKKFAKSNVKANENDLVK